MPLRPPFIFLFLTIPWLTPFAPGPSPAVMPWLVAVLAAAGLIVFSLIPAGSGQRSGDRSFARNWAIPFAWALVAAGVLSAVMGLLQYFGAAEALEPWVRQGKFGEAYANLRQRNQFASLTNMALVAVLWLAVRSGVPQKQAGGSSDALAEGSGRAPAWRVWRRRAIAAGLIAAGALLAAGNAASLSRTGLLQLVMLAVLIGWWGVWRQAWPRTVFLVAVVVYTASLFALPYLAGFDMSEQGMLARLRDGAPACSSRFTLWSNVLHLIAQKPWLGWGLGELDFAHYMTLYGDDLRFCEILDNAHNLPLHIAVELGIPAALLATGAIAWWVTARRPWSETNGARRMAWGLLAVIGLHSLLEYPLWYGPFQIAAGLCIAILWPRTGGASGPQTAQNDAADAFYEKNRPAAQSIRAGAAIILIVAAGYATWDYFRISQVYLPAEQRDLAFGADAMAQAKKSRLFRNQVEFAELTITPVTKENAKAMFISAHRVLHYSPEPRVIEKAIESAVVLGLDDDALAHLARYRAAFPKEHAAWARGHERALEAAMEAASAVSK
jgi:O-antigen ligase